MATSVRLIRRYVWLVDTIRRAGNITLEEINRKWMEERTLRLESEKDFPERTFHRHRRAITDIFGIEILCNRYNGNTYYIGNEEALNTPSFTSWLFNALAIDNQIIDNKEISRRILFEETPGGMEYMPVVIQALSEKRKLLVTYNSISHGNYTDKKIEPYFIKERLRRWYIVGRAEGHDDVEVFAFDRIERLSLLDEKFEFDADIDPKTYFDEVVGILLDDEYDCERVVVRLYGKQGEYVNLLPLHKSQKVVDRGKNYIDFEYMLRPEWEFIHEVLRLGYEAEVLSPAWVREELKWQAQEIVNRYNKNNPSDEEILHPKGLRGNLPIILTNVFAFVLSLSAVKAAMSTGVSVKF